MQQKITLEKFYPGALITLSALFLFYKYIMQVYPSIITNQLMRAFHVHGLGLGNLAASFFYSYMVTQIFVGVLLDKFSPRYLTSAAILCCAIGTYLFSDANSIYLAIAARILMGIGAAFATVSYMKLAANWFPKNQFAFVTGLLATAAMLGALCGEAPMAWLIDQIGWRASLMACGIAGLVFAALFFIIVRDAPDSGPLANLEKYQFKFADLRKILSKGQNWILTFYSGLSFAPVAVLGGLWGPPFIREAYNLSNTKAASLVSLAFLGLAIGAPIVGYLTDHMNDRRRVMAFGSFITFISVLLVIYVNGLPLVIVGFLFFLFGLSVSTFMLGFTIGKEINPIVLAASVIALINTGDAIFGAVTEPMVGKFLDLDWQQKLIDGVPYFGVENYHRALAVLPVYLFIAFVLTFFVKEGKT